MMARLAPGTAEPAFALRTEWVLASPIEPIWDALVSPETWPSWWRYARSVVPLRPGDARGVGAVRRYTWSSRLPYRLVFEMTTTEIARPAFLSGTATGELNGTGCWRLAAAAGVSHVEYAWLVTPGKRWMRALTPALAPAFRWNHDQVMAEGARGLARHLGVTLLSHARR